MRIIIEVNIFYPFCRFFILVTNYFPMSMFRIFVFADALKISEKQIDTLEQQLEASERARRDAEAEAKKVDELKAKLEAAEKACDDAKAKAASFEERIARIDERETSLVSRIKALSNKFYGWSYDLLTSCFAYFRFAVFIDDLSL